MNTYRIVKRGDIVGKMIGHCEMIPIVIESLLPFVAAGTRGSFFPFSSYRSQTD